MREDENPLSYWRGKRGLKLRELSEKSKVGIATISRIEHGQKAYRSTIGKLAIALKIELDELSTLEKKGSGATYS